MDKSFESMMHVTTTPGVSGNSIKGVLVEKKDIILPSGRTLFRRIKKGENTMLIGATQLIAKHLTGLSTGMIDILTLDKSLEATITPTVSVTKAEQVYCGLMLCNGGSDGNVVRAVQRYMPGFTSSNKIPWRMVSTASENATSLFADYGCRSVEAGMAKYYIKKLKNITPLNRTVDEEITLVDRPDLNLSGDITVETIIKTGFNITLEDMAEYYASIGENVTRKFSTISIFLGNTVNVSVGGATHSDHRNLLCANQLNIEEEYLKQNKEAEYEYTIHMR